jgi:hypothetical protein
MAMLFNSPPASSSAITGIMASRLIQATRTSQNSLNEKTCPIANAQRTQTPHEHGHTDHCMGGDVNDGMGLESVAPHATIISNQIQTKGS